MANTLDMQALQMFCDVVETRSFSRAAERNFVSQSAVSQRIRALERSYGQTLLDRGQGRGVLTPTDAGQVLYDGAKRLLREANELDTEMRGLSEEVAGTVRVATVYSVGLHALPPRLKPFVAAYPRVSVHLEYRQTGEVYQDVAVGNVDAGIVACPVARRGVEVIPFAEEPMAVICAPEHPFAQESALHLTQLEGAPFIGFESDIPTRRLIDEHLRLADVRVRPVMTFENIETIKNLVEIGSGVSILPADTVRQEVRGGTLVAVPLVPADAFLRPTGILVKDSKTRRAAVRAFLEAIRDPAAG